MRHVSRLRIERLVDCPLSAVEEAVHGELRDGPGLIVARHPDEEEPGRLHDAILVEWVSPRPFVPRFHGTLRLRIASVRGTRVIVEGAYRPPFGALGTLLDRLIGRGLAIRALTRRLDAFCRTVERSERARLLSGIAV